MNQSNLTKVEQQNNTDSIVPVANMWILYTKRGDKDGGRSQKKRADGGINRWRNGLWDTDYEGVL